MINMKNILIIFEGSGSSSGKTPLTDMIKTRFGSLLSDWEYHTFKYSIFKKRKYFHKIYKLLKEAINKDVKILFIGKSMGAVRIKQFFNKYWYIFDDINTYIITIDPHSPLYYGVFKKQIYINIGLSKTENIYQTQERPKGCKVITCIKSICKNHRVNSNHSNIIYNKITMNTIRKKLLED